ncbi:MAG: hypothetical protein Q8O30_00755 [Candidatus Omnitrophota bacterium]|nr:hypothetical protein [Candidatus Omnitrophota bacterium]
MKYLFYLGWATVFYILLKIIGRFTGSVTPLISLVAAFLIPLFLKRFLPLLKDKKFTEIVSFINHINKKINGMAMRSKKCAICNTKADFRIVLEYGIDKDLNARKQKTFCRTHGLIELRKVLARYQIMIIFAEPDIKQISGSFFYEPQQLKIHGYLDADRADLEKLIAQFPREHTYEKILWFGKDTIGVCQKKPLFKKKAIGEYITVDELIKRMRSFLEKLESKFKNSEYWLTEPHGKSGIYIWDGEV